MVINYACNELPEKFFMLSDWRIVNLTTEVNPLNI